MSHPAGCVVALVGPNGSGKTTLMHMTAGLLLPTEGHVDVAGAPPAARLDRIGFVAQDAPLWPRMRVGAVLEAGRHLNPGFDATLARSRVNQLGIPRRARIRPFAGGQRAQVALTLVLAKKAELLLLDEPLANLDPLARREFLGSMLGACTETGAAVLFSSHVEAELERIGDYLIVLREGRVRVACDIDELRQSHRVISGPAGWEQTEAWQVVSTSTAAGRTTALVTGASAITGPGLDEALPTFDELVLGYLGEARPSPREALT